MNKEQVVAMSTCICVLWLMLVPSFVMSIYALARLG